MLPNVGFGELVVIFTVALLFLGGDRLPKVARGLGEAMKAFRDELRRVNSSEPDDDKAIEEKKETPSH